MIEGTENTEGTQAIYEAHFRGKTLEFEDLYKGVFECTCIAGGYCLHVSDGRSTYEDAYDLRVSKQNLIMTDSLDALLQQWPYVSLTNHTTGDEIFCHRHEQYYN